MADVKIITGKLRNGDLIEVSLTIDDCLYGPLLMTKEHAHQFYNILRLGTNILDTFQKLPDEWRVK